MKGIEYVVIVAGILVIIWLLTSRESFVTEFTDRTNEARTAQTATSSYAQQTNHLVPTPKEPTPISGIETPFRVNMFTSFQPA
uniref:Uncharacterized protein n=1 Tax=viral metagenome TaxID=1070528 RepID=A0A6C0JXV2_9ZZZZ